MWGYPALYSFLSPRTATQRPRLQGTMVSNSTATEEAVEKSQVDTHPVQVAEGGYGMLWRFSVG